MKTERFWFYLIGLMLLMMATGCTRSTDTGADTVKELESTILQMRAENRNLSSRLKSLDDQLVLHETRQSLQRQDNRRDSLRTVRLTPDAAVHPEGTGDIAEEISLASTPPAAQSTAPRLVLTLNEHGDPAPAPLASARSATRPAVAGDYNHIVSGPSGDNLGVVRGGARVVTPAGNEPVSGAQSEPMELFNAAYRSYANGDHASAISGFSEFLQKESSHAYADAALFWIGECFLAQGRLTKAIGEFERLLRRYPGSRKGASALYRIGFIYEQMKDMERARAYYVKVMDQYPGSDAASRATRKMSGNGGNNHLVRTSAQRE